MKNFKKRSFKEKAQLVLVCILYPLMLFFAWLGKSVKLFSTKNKQIVASALVFAIIASVLPISAINAFAESRGITETYYSKAENIGKLDRPILGDSLKDIPTNCNGGLYLGEYPQESTDPNYKTPVKWLATMFSLPKDRQPTMQELVSSAEGTLTLTSEKILDRISFMDSSPKWITMDKRWHKFYSASNLNAFSGWFYRESFNAIEQSALWARVIVPEQTNNFAGNWYYPAESFEANVYAPYYYAKGPYPHQETMAEQVGCEAGYRLEAFPTPYASAKGVVTGKYSGDYWFRTPGHEETPPTAQVVKATDRMFAYHVNDARRQQHGYRPMTRLLDTSVTMVSTLGTKDFASVVNAEIKEGTPWDYKVTLVDPARSNFTAGLEGETNIEGEYLNVPVSYSNAVTGDNEYLSYTLVNEKDTIVAYERLKKSTTANGKFNLKIPISAMQRSKYKVNIFNEKLVAGVGADYSSARKTIPIDLSRAPAPVFTIDKIECIKGEESIPEANLRIHNNTDFSTEGSWNLFTDVDCKNEVAIESATFDGKDLIIKPQSKSLPIGPYYVTYTPKNSLRGLAGWFGVNPYGPKTLKIHYNYYRPSEQGGSVWTTSKYITYTEGDDKNNKFFDPGSVPNNIQMYWVHKATGKKFYFEDKIDFDLMKSLEIKTDYGGHVELDVHMEEIEKPVIHSVTVTPTEGWTTEATIVVDATVDPRFGTPWYFFNFSDSQGVTGFIEFENFTTITENYPKLEVWVRGDGYHESEVITVSINNIDNVKPTVTLQGDTASKNPSTLTILPTAGVSGVASVFLCKDNEEFIEIPNNNGYTYQVTANGTYSVMVMNGAGARVTETITYNNFDDIKPVVSVNLNGYTENTWKTDGDITINLSNTAANTSPITYQVKKGTGEWQDCASELVISEDCDTTYSFKAISSSGIVSDEQIVIVKRDTQAPSVILQGDTASYSPSTLSISPTAGITGIYKVELKKDNGTFTEIPNDRGYTYSVTENGTYTVMVTNGAGVVAVQTITYNKIDSVKPVVSVNLNGYTENTWKTDGNITINLSNLASNTSPITYQVKKEAGEWQDCASEIVISEDCLATTYTFKATSAAGVASDEQTIIVKRDVTAPTNVNLSYGTDSFKEFLNTITFGLFFKDTVTVTMTSTDSTSGVKEFKYTLNDGEKTIPATNGSATFNIEPQFKGNIKSVKAIDNSGKISTEVATEYFAIDNQNPVAPTVNANGYEKGTWSKDPVTFTLTGATATSGVAKYQYSTDNGRTWVDMQAKEKTDATASEPFNVTKAELVLNNNTSGENFIFRAVSNSGNFGAVTTATNVKIDTTLPTITVAGNTADYKTEDVLTITPTADISGITKVEIKKDNGTFTEIKNASGYSYKVTENGTYTAKVTNGSGVTATTSIVYNKIDSAKPVVAINSNGYISDSWENTKDITISVTNTTQNLGTTNIQYKINSGEWQNYTSDIIIDTDSPATTYTFKATSAAGVVSDEQTIIVKRDVTAPTNVNLSYGTDSFKEFLNTITFGLFFKDTVTVTMTSSDVTSGVKEFKYTLNNTEKTIPSTSGSATFNIEPQFKGNIKSVKAIDNSGKISAEVATEYFAIDSQNPLAPTVNANGYIAGSWSKDPVTFTLSGATATSGIAKYQYSTDNGITWIDMQAKEKTVATASEPFNVTKAELVLNNNTSGENFIFRTVSNSANFGEVTTATNVKIDTTLPTITVAGNTADFKTEDVLTITPTADISGITKVEIKKDNGTFTESKNNSGYKYTIKENGTYTAKVTNGSGVTATTSIVYTKIDSAKPVVAVDSHGYTSDSWENTKDITISLSNTTQNLGTTNIQYKVNNGEWQSYNTDIIIDTDSPATTYTFKATSAAGVASDEQTFIVKRDVTAPTNVNLSYGTDSFKEFLNTITFGLFFKDTVTVTMTSSDVTSGVKEFKYTLNNTEKTIPANSGSATFNIEPQFKGNISNVKAIDNSGKISAEVATEYFAIDSQNPLAPTVNANGYIAGSWSKDPVTFTLSGATATSGIAKYQYSTDNGITWIDMQAKEKTVATASEPFNVTKAELVLNNNTSGENFIFRTVSNSANFGAVTTATNVKIDTTLPTITVAGNTADFKTEDVLTITPTADISGITKVELKKDNGTFTEIKNNNGYKYTIKENGTYTAKVTNGTGVSATTSIVYTKIDSAKPVVAIDSNGYISDSWENTKDITISLSNTTQNLGTTSIQYKINSGEWQSYTSDIIIDTDSPATTYTFKATSAAGVASDEQTFIVKRDTVFPDGDINYGENSVRQFLNKITFGMFFNETVDVTISASDATSGVQKIEYFKSETVLHQAEIEAITNWTEENKFNLTPTDKEKFIIYVRIIDNAGLAVVFASDGATFDVTAPLISGTTDGETYYTTQKVTITDDNIKTMTLNDVPVLSGELTLSGNIAETYTISAIDKAGNETKVTVTMKPIATLTTSIDSINEKNVTLDNKEDISLVKISAKEIDTTNATAEEKDMLNAIIKKCDVLFEKITETTDEIQRITKAVEAYSENKVKSTDKKDLTTLKADIKKLTDSDNLTQVQKTELAKLDTTVDRLLKKIADTELASKPTSFDKVKEITFETVKLLDKDGLSKAKADFEKALKTFENNYTKAETKVIEDKLKKINEALKTIDNTQKVLDKIAALPAPDAVTTNDANAIREAKKVYDALSDYEKTLVNAPVLKELNKGCTALANLLLKEEQIGIEVIAVGDTILDPNTVLRVLPIDPTESQKRSVQVVANNSELVSLYDISLLLGGVKIEPNGKVKVTLTITDEQLKAFKNFKIVFIDENGKSKVLESQLNGNKISFETDGFSHYGIIADPIKTALPPTADTQNPALWLILFLSLTAIVLLITMKSRKKSKQLTK